MNHRLPSSLFQEEHWLTDPNGCSTTPLSGTSLDDMRNNVSGVEFAYRTVFADRLREADAGLADSVTKHIEQLKTVVKAPDLPHVDVRALRRSSEELVVSLQAASAKLGLRRSTLEAQSR